MHHQAVDKLGENLEVLYEFEGVAKIYSSHDELILGSQIHPEIYLQFMDQAKIAAIVKEIQLGLESIRKKYLSELIEEKEYKKIEAYILENLEIVNKLHLMGEKNREIYTIFVERVHRFMAA
jgi:hypothetical protein